MNRYYRNMAFSPLTSIFSIQWEILLITISFATYHLDKIYRFYRWHPPSLILEFYIYKHTPYFGVIHNPCGKRRGREGLEACPRGRLPIFGVTVFGIDIYIDMTKRCAEFTRSSKKCYSWGGIWKIHMAFKVRSAKKPFLSTRGRGVKNVQKSVHLICGCPQSIENELSNYGFFKILKTIPHIVVIYTLQNRPPKLFTKLTFLICLSIGFLKVE